MIGKNKIKYIHSLELKKNRETEGLFVAEGPKVVGDLMAAFVPETLVATEEWYAAAGVEPRDGDYVVTPDELRKTSFMQHPQQVVGLFPIPHPAVAPSICADGLCLALDGVQDPGNLGTIIRIADWFGIEAIFCGEGTADAFSPKVVQAAMGSIARVKIVYTELETMLKALPEGTPVYATALDGNDIYSHELTTDGIIIMGNEGKGVSPEVMRLANRRLLIPRYGRTEGADSLNVAVATAITCAEFRRRQL